MQNANKITDISCKAFPEYLNQIIHIKEKLTSLKVFSASVDCVGLDPVFFMGNDHHELLDGSKADQMMESWINFTYIDFLLEISTFVPVVLKYSGPVIVLLDPRLARFYTHTRCTLRIQRLTGPITSELLNSIHMFEIDEFELNDVSLLRNVRETLTINSLYMFNKVIENCDFSKTVLRELKIFGGSIDAKSFNTLYATSVQTITLGMSLTFSDNDNIHLVPKSVKAFHCHANMLKSLRFPETSILSELELTFSGKSNIKANDPYWATLPSSISRLVIDSEHVGWEDYTKLETFALSLPERLFPT
ncbi:unnamed protein product [Ambrosiozyma monospora]|uniref:Unnamed protein product n=1 Tax=Ambrosiozyma monospora TaxID=43982 RepID=A0ACB5U4H7_AMBMO|nr:unnamed protein product [Ambrosiozyma monospora]